MLFSFFGGVVQEKESNMGFCWMTIPRDDRAERNRGLRRGSAQQGHPGGWKRPSTTEPHIRSPDIFCEPYFTIFTVKFLY